MNEQKIIITFTDQGPVIEVQGVKGSACQTLTEDLEKALGQVENVERKPEFYVRGQTGDQIRQGR